MTLNVERNRSIIEMRRADIGPREIARRLNVSAQVVAGVLHRAKLTSRPLGRGHGASETYKAAAVAAVKDAPSMSAAAREWGVHRSILWRWCDAAERAQ